MKKVLGMMLASGLLLASSAATMASTVTVGGDAKLGYDFAKTAYDGKKGASDSNMTIKVTGEINSNIMVYGEVKSSDLSKGDYFTDEAWAYLKFAPLNLKVGYYGFGFTEHKDILNSTTEDYQANVGVQAETIISGKISAQLYFPLRADNDKDNITQVHKNKLSGDNAFAVRLGYNKEKYGILAIYGQTDCEDRKEVSVAANGETIYNYFYDTATTYALSTYYKPSKSCKTYFEYSNETKSLRSTTLDRSKAKNTAMLIGVLYTPENSPFECRLEYDIDDEYYDWSGNSTTTGFNPWGARLGYKLNPNTKVEVNWNQKSKTDWEKAVRLVLYF